MSAACADCLDCHRHCGAGDLVKNGRNEYGTQRYCRNGCGKIFQNEYSYNDRKPGMKEWIETRTLDSGGVGDTGRNRGILKFFVVNATQSAQAPSPTLTEPFPLPYPEKISTLAQPSGLPYQGCCARCRQRAAALPPCRRDQPWPQW